ncbi:MAG TPA: prepilin-type N-terminal cleavage/methylation domain-containing protein [bacterium]|nr:prepilin-type N-terminal cleavage/methylation domain-containing protein [bacterium]
MTRKCQTESRPGFTLVELMVVLLIIGILSTVALRTIDATRDRGLFDQTTKAMNKLVQAAVGNPDLTYDGRRVDFGFFGDMERLPDVPLDLLERPNTSDASIWNGPYLHPTGVEPDSDYLKDGWGNSYSFSSGSGTFMSTGNGKYSMTMRLADSLPQLSQNTITGTLSDADGNPPGSTLDSSISIRFYYNNPILHGKAYDSLIPTAGGYYNFSPGSPTGFQGVPMGIHKLQAIMSGETLTRWVTSQPRSRTVVDMKFNLSFWTKLVLVGQPVPKLDSTGFYIVIGNEQKQDITIDSLQFITSPSNAYMMTFIIDGTSYSPPLGVGPGGAINFTPVTVPASMARQVIINFLNFNQNQDGSGADAKVVGQQFKIGFSDGSEIVFTVPNPS